MIIGIDFSFVHPMEVKTGYLYRSFELAVRAVLNGFVNLNLEAHFVLIVNHYAADFVSKLFPHYKLCVVDFLFSDLMYQFSKGKKAANTWGKKFGAYKKAVKRYSIDLMWYPYGLPENMGHCDIPYVCTINDIINYHLTDDNSLKKSYRSMIESSSSIVTISDFVKDDVSASFDYRRDLITTIPICIKKPAEPQQEYHTVNSPYILDINGYGPHKNTFTLIKAFEIIKDEVPHNLVLCGGWKDEEYYSRILKYIEDNGLEKRIQVLFSVSSDQKNWLLHNADIFVTPSLNEGFGMTPVEAAMCNVPVISTKVSSLYEVTLGAVNYIEDPENPEELAALIKNVLNDPPSKEYLQSLSDKLVERYSENRCAGDYWKLFSSYI